VDRGYVVKDLTGYESTTEYWTKTRSHDSSCHDTERAVHVYRAPLSVERMHACIASASVCHDRTVCKPRNVFLTIHKPETSPSSVLKNRNERRLAS